MHASLTRDPAVQAHDGGADGLRPGCPSRWSAGRAVEHPRRRSRRPACCRSPRAVICGLYGAWTWTASKPRSRKNAPRRRPSRGPIVCVVSAPLPQPGTSRRIARGHPDHLERRVGDVHRVVDHRRGLDRPAGDDGHVVPERGQPTCLAVDVLRDAAQGRVVEVGDDRDAHRWACYRGPRPGPSRAGPATIRNALVPKPSHRVRCPAPSLARCRAPSPDGRAARLAGLALSVGPCQIRRSRGYTRRDADFRVLVRDGHTFDVLQKFADDALDECEVCGSPAQRMLHPVAIHFKGSGFYRQRPREEGRRPDTAKTRPPRATRLILVVVQGLEVPSRDGDSSVLGDSGLVEAKKAAEA